MDNIKEYVEIKIENEIDICSICLQEYKDSETVFLKECKHIFHLNCITSWENFTEGLYFDCPVCRNSVRKINLKPVLKKRKIFCLFKKLLRIIMTLVIMLLVAALFVLFYR